MAYSHTRSRATPAAIGALSERTGVKIETIRYYERIGLIPAPPRSEGRRRLYDETHRQRLVFIRRARELGFSLENVRRLLGLSGRHTQTCGEVKALAQHHIGEIRTKIRNLKRLERTLSELAARCQGDAVPECPILKTLGNVR
ncbi:MAG: helix-turn-helix domain-containing protein [Dongiaceae bacterium]